MGIGQVDGEQLLDLDMKKFRQEKQEVWNTHASSLNIHFSTNNVATIHGDAGGG